MPVAPLPKTMGGGFLGRRIARRRRLERHTQLAFDSLFRGGAVSPGLYILFICCICGAHESGRTQRIA